MLLPDTYQCGGILGVKKVAALAESAGVPCVFHCAHDLGPKTAAMLHVVASSPGFTLANDCTYYGLEAGLTHHWLPRFTEPRMTSSRNSVFQAAWRRLQAILSLSG